MEVIDSSQLETMMDVRLGVSSQEDVLPDRIVSGMEDPDRYLDTKRRYYQLRNWTQDGAS